MSATQTLTPHVYWAQRHGDVQLRVDLCDAEVRGCREDEPPRRRRRRWWCHGGGHWACIGDDDGLGLNVHQK